MTKLLGTAGAFVGSTVGWDLGEHAGLFAAFVVSMAGTGVGLYLGRRLARGLGG